MARLDMAPRYLDDGGGFATDAVRAVRVAEVGFYPGAWPRPPSSASGVVAW
jgi:hypothetical protein